MTSTGRRRTALLAPVAVSAILVAGCGAGQEAATADQVTSASGAVGGVGSIAVRDAAFAYDRPVAGDEVYGPGDDAPLQVTIVNVVSPGVGDGDRLVSVSSPVATSGLVLGDAGVPDGQVLTSGYVDPPASVTMPDTERVAIVLVDLLVPVRAGMSYPVVFTFEQAGDVVLDVPVENPDLLPPRARDLDLPEEDRTLETGPEVSPEAADVGETP